MTVSFIMHEGERKKLARISDTAESILTRHLKKYISN